MSVVIPAFYFLPSGYLFALASQPVSVASISRGQDSFNLSPILQLAINVIAELVPGYLIPGNSVVNMVNNLCFSRLIDVRSQLTLHFIDVKSILDADTLDWSDMYTGHETWSLYENCASGNFLW
jgi:hypothetical protein